MGYTNYYGKGRSRAAADFEYKAQSEWLKQELEMVKTLPRVDIYSVNAPEELKDHFEKYIHFCIENNREITPSNYAASLGLTGEHFKKVCSGVTKALPEVADFFRYVMAWMEDSMVHNMLAGESNVVASIFLSKNFFGFKDTQEQIVVHEDRRLTAEQLKELAANLPDVIDADYHEIGGEIEQKDDAETEGADFPDAE